MKWHLLGSTFLLWWEAKQGSIVVKRQRGHAGGEFSAGTPPLLHLYIYLYFNYFPHPCPFLPLLMARTRSDQSALRVESFNKPGLGGRKGTHFTETGLKKQWASVTGELSLYKVENLVSGSSLEVLVAWDGSLLGHLLLNVLQEFIVGRGRLGPILHQVLEQSSFSRSIIPAGDIRVTQTAKELVLNTSL